MDASTVFPMVGGILNGSGTGWGLHALCALLVSAHCLMRRRDPRSTMLWMFIAAAFPLVGPLFYLAVGVDRVPDKGFRKHAKDQRLLAERRAREDETLPLAYWRSVHEAVRGEPGPGLVGELNRAFDAVLPDHPLLGGNALTPLVTGEEAFPRMLDAIEGARHHIHLQSFMICNDRIGRTFLDRLAAKAREGLTVRVLYDRFGSTQGQLTGLFRRLRGVPNLNIVGWTQANPLKRQFQVNLRNHRKLMVVDGNRAFCGGINLQEENTASRGRPAIRDYHFDIRGPFVQELQYSFLRDWYFMTEEDPEILLTETFFPHVEPAGAAMIRLVNSGPTPLMEALPQVLFLALIAARKRILAVTPYFVPPADIVMALRAAALRGVEVRLVVPKRSNHAYAGWAGKALYGELLNAGVRIFERRPPFIHAKALIVDDTFAMVGTANLDVRSLRLNYETNLAVYDDGFVNRLKQIVSEDLSASDGLDAANWAARPARQRVVENLAYLMMPVL